MNSRDVEPIEQRGATEYFIHEGALTLAGFVDASANSLVYERPEGEVRVDVTRAPGSRAPLSRLVEAELTRERRELPSFAAELPIAHMVGQTRAMETFVTFTRNGEARTTRRLHLLAGSTSMTVGVSGPSAAREAIDALFDRIKSTLTLEPAFRP